MRHGFSSQPGWPAPIDTSHPIGAKVTASFANHFNGMSTEMVSNARGTFSTNHMKKLPSARGFGTTHPGSPASIYYPASSAFGDCTLPFSYDGLYTALSTAASTFDRLIDFGGAQSSGGWDLEIDGSANILVVFWNIVNPSGFPFGGSSIASPGQTHHIAFTFVPGGTLKLYLDGRLINTGSPTPTAPSGNLFVLNGLNAAASNSGKFAHYLHRIYQGTILTAADIASLAVNPWQIYRPARGIRGVGFAGPPLVTSQPFLWVN